MSGFLVRLLIAALGLWLAQALVSGIEFRDTWTLFVAALLLGIVNAFVRPFVVFLTLPITIVTLGLFLWVVNALMLELVAHLLTGFMLGGFGSALLGALVISITGWIASWYVGPSGRFEVMIVRR